MAFKVLRNGCGTSYPRDVLRGDLTAAQYKEKWCEPGDILYRGSSLTGLVTIFATQEEAEEAIDRSIEFGKNKGWDETWCYGYEIVETDDQPNAPRS